MHPRRAMLFFTVALATSGCVSPNSFLADSHQMPSTSKGHTDVVASPEEIKEYFVQQGKIVLTFTGFSGSGYENSARMLSEARSILAKHDPQTTIVNIGATLDGMGTVYEVAKQMQFTTTGIVSTQAKKRDATISPYVDRVFFVEDETWGGYVEGTDKLSPTSTAMVENSTIMIGIGGGEVGRDELLAAKRAGKKVHFIPADMNHERAIRQAQKKGLPEPTNFKGAAAELAW